MSYFSAELLNQKHQIEDAMEQRLGLLTKVTNKRKRKNDESSETTGGEISIAFLEAEKIKVKVRVNVNIPNQMLKFSKVGLQPCLVIFIYVSGDKNIQIINKNTSLRHTIAT